MCSWRASRPSAGRATGAPQVIVPGRVFERIYNAGSIERAGAGRKLDSFDSETLRGACREVAETASFADAALALRRSLAASGGAAKVVSVVEKAVGT